MGKGELVRVQELMRLSSLSSDERVFATMAIVLICEYREPYV